MLTILRVDTRMPDTYCQTSITSRTKSQNLNVSLLVMKLSLPNPLMPGVKSIMRYWRSTDRWCSNYIWVMNNFIVRRAGLLWSQQDFEWRWSVPLFKCLTVLEFSFILCDLCLLITFFNFIMNYVPIVTFWIFTYHKIWILSIMFCFIWSYLIIYFSACLEVSWRVVS